MNNFTMISVSMNNINPIHSDIKDAGIKNIGIKTQRSTHR